MLKLNISKARLPGCFALVAGSLIPPVTMNVVPRKLRQRFVSSVDQHPEIRKQRFPEYLWRRTSDSKEANEVWIFLEFADAAALRVDTAPSNCQPPMPDLECVIDGKRRLFELGEILESNLAEGIDYSGKQAHKKMEANSRGDSATARSVQTVGSRSFAANAALNKVLQAKLTKKYDTKELPTDLLLFYDQQMPLGPFDYLLQFQNKLEGLISKSVFGRIWLFYLQSAILIGYLEARDGALHMVFDWRFHFDPHVMFEALVPGGGHTPDEVKRFAPVLTGTSTKTS